MRGGPAFRFGSAPVLMVCPSSTGARLLNTFLTISLQIVSNGPVRRTYHLHWGRRCLPFLSFPEDLSSLTVLRPLFVLSAARGCRLITGAKHRSYKEHARRQVRETESSGRPESSVSPGPMGAPGKQQGSKKRPLALYTKALWLIAPVL